jgi:hypothetical protein
VAIMSQPLHHGPERAQVDRVVGGAGHRALRRGDGAQSASPGPRRGSSAAVARCSSSATAAQRLGTTALGPKDALPGCRTAACPAAGRRASGRGLRFVLRRDRKACAVVAARHAHALHQPSVEPTTGVGGGGRLGRRGHHVVRSAPARRRRSPRGVPRRAPDHPRRAGGWPRQRGRSAPRRRRPRRATRPCRRRLARGQRAQPSKWGGPP